MDDINIEGMTNEELSLLYRQLGLKMAEAYKRFGPKTVNKRPEWFWKLMHNKPSFRRDFNDFADHIEFLENGVVVIEPYHRNIQDFDDFVQSCKFQGLEFMVSGKSYHFPGHCFQVKIAPLELEKTVYEKEARQ